MFSFVGDTVLDPFLGSGTTCLAARNLKRNSIGYEINEDFLPVIKEKLKIVQHPEDFEIIIQGKKSVDFAKEIITLSYIFKDPVKFDKKIDPKKLRFGSKIDKEEYQRETYYSVKDIISSELLVLNNDLRIRLIGVKEKQGLNGKALQFLKEKLQGEKVFIKFDSTKYDHQGNLLCYLYLRNKTFINAHLIKNHLAQVDTSLDFKYKSKFIDLQNNSKKEAIG